MCKNLDDLLKKTPDPSPATVDPSAAASTTAGDDPSKVTPNEGGGAQLKPDGSATDKPQDPEGDGAGGGTIKKPDGTNVDVPERKHVSQIILYAKKMVRFFI